MLNNLLSQLINQILTSNLRPKLVDHCLSEADPQVSELCDLFIQLAEALPTGTILFCIVDGISYYEDAERRAECSEVLSMLTSLSRRNHSATIGPLIKLLVTAPLRSHFAYQLFEEEEILNMDENYPSNGGFSALQWDVGMGKVLDQ